MVERLIVIVRYVVVCLFAVLCCAVYLQGIPVSWLYVFFLLVCTRTVVDISRYFTRSYHWV